MTHGTGESRVRDNYSASKLEAPATDCGCPTCGLVVVHVAVEAPAAGLGGPEVDHLSHRRHQLHRPAGCGRRAQYLRQGQGAGGRGRAGGLWLRLARGAHAAPTGQSGEGMQRMRAAQGRAGDACKQAA